MEDTAAYFASVEKRFAAVEVTAAQAHLLAVAMLTVLSAEQRSRVMRLLRLGADKLENDGVAMPDESPARKLIAVLEKTLPMLI